MTVQLRAAFRVAPGASGRPALAIACRECGVVEVGSDKTNCPPPIAAKHFIARGWRVVRDGASATCPKCQARPAAPSAGDVEVELERQRERERRRIAAEENMPKNDLLKAQARLHHLLSEHFSAEGDVGTYDEGWSDERISTETGLSRAEVARVREGAYGRLVDPRLAALERAVAEARAKLEDDASTLQGMLEALRGQTAERLSVLERALAELRR